MSAPAVSTIRSGVQEPAPRSTAPAPPSPEGRNSGIQAEIQRIHAFLKASGRMEEFRRLQKPRPGIALAQALLSWLLVVLAWLLTVSVSTAFIPVSLIIIASRQRALGNTLHDAAHGNVWRRGAEWLAQWLLAAPMLEELALYRRDHLAHHARLGDPREDPDFLDIPARLKGTPGARSPGLIYLYTALDPALWLRHLLGELPRLPWHGLVRCILWWGTILTVIGLTLGSAAALGFAGLWFGARATLYHLLKVFTELSDHVGLRVGSILGYTRNMPSNWASLVLHPHNDAYHLTHHLAPRVCMHNLPRVHAMLMELPEYRNGHHCDGYLFGKYPVARSWARPKPLPSLP